MRGRGRGNERDPGEQKGAQRSAALLVGDGCGRRRVDRPLRQRICPLLDESQRDRGDCNLSFCPANRFGIRVRRALDGDYRRAMRMPVYMHFSLSSGWIYRQWDAPDGHDSITIRYREATLGESRFFYEVYRSAGGGGWLLKHLPREDFEVTVRAGEPAGGIRNVQWADESTLQFDAQGERRSISLY